MSEIDSVRYFDDSALVTVVVTPNKPLPVLATFAPAALANVNLTEIDGTAAAVGAGASNTGTLRVVTATDSVLASITAPVGVEGQDGATKASTANPVPVVTPIPASAVLFQYKVTAAAVQMAANVLVNGLALKAKNTNAGPVFIGGAGVTATNDGTGNSFALYPGDTLSLAISNSNVLYAIGTANDVLYFAGN